jgi:hypothetical protein
LKLLEQLNSRVQYMISEDSGRADGLSEHVTYVEGKEVAQHGILLRTGYKPLGAHVQELDAELQIIRDS